MGLPCNSAVFQVQGRLDSEALEGLGRDLRDAADSGIAHLVIDLDQACQQLGSSHWSAFRPVLEELTRRGTSLTVRGGAPDVVDGLRSAGIEAQMRLLDREDPQFFSKSRP